MPHKLLLADDSVTIQRVIELTFADEDVQVVAVGNGQQAIERAEREAPDIVLADIGMPERDGYEVAAFIKGHPTLSHIPVVLLTGAFEPIDENRARAVGCDGVLVKPFEPQMVINRVKDLLAGRRPSEMWGSGPAAQGPVRVAASEFDLRPATTTPASGDPLEAYFDRLDAAFSAKGGSAPADAPEAAASSGAPTREPIPLSKPAAPAQSEAASDDLSGWDPELAGNPTMPAPKPFAAPAPTPFPFAVPTPPQVPAAAQARPGDGDIGGWDPDLTGDASPAFTISAPPVARPVAVVPPPAPAAVATSAAPVSLVDAFAALLSAEERAGISPSAAPRLSGAAAAPDDRVIEEVTQRVLARLSDEARPSILDVAERLVRDEIDRIKQNR
jgi:CheY-like chemotaxis protein